MRLPWVSVGIVSLLVCLLAVPDRGVAQESVKSGRKAVSAVAPAGVRIIRDVPYLAPGRAEKLDLYLSEKAHTGPRLPAVVMIHGGGWTGGSKSASREFNVGTTLALAGYVCASIEYWKEGPNRWPTNLYDCKNAVRFLRKHASDYNIDPDRIGVMGGSAGAHLALMVAYTAGNADLSSEALYPGISDRVSACVDMYGPTDLLTRQETEPDGTPNGKFREAGLIPDRRGENESKWKLVSPVFHVKKDNPPTLILHGMTDTTVDRNQSQELARKLQDAGVEHQLVLLTGIGHTFDLERWNRKPLPQDVKGLVLKFLEKHLGPVK